MSLGKFVSLFSKFASLFSKAAGRQTASLLERYLFYSFFFKDFVSIFSNFLGVLVFWGPLLNSCFQSVANAQAINVVWKFVLRKKTFVCFCFLGMIKTILNILFLFRFNFKTQISFYILIDDSVTNFFKCFILCYIILILLITLRQK